jgi:hypothetical protein
MFQPSHPVKAGIRGIDAGPHAVPLLEAVGLREGAAPGEPHVFRGIPELGLPIGFQGRALVGDVAMLANSRVEGGCHNTFLALRMASWLLPNWVALNQTFLVLLEVRKPYLVGFRVAPGDGVDDLHTASFAAKTLSSLP